MRWYGRSSAVGIASISYDETSQELINMRNKGAMMGDPSVREGYVQTTIAEGLKGAGTNSNGAMAGYMGMGFGMQNSGAFMGAASATNMQQMQMNRQMQQGQQMPYGTGNGGSRADRWVMEQQMQAPKQSGRRRLQISRGSVLPAMWKTQENSAASVENQGLP